MRRLLAMVAVIAAGCGRTGFLGAGDDDTGSATIPDVVGFPTLPDSIDPADEGDGRDGPLDVNGGTLIVNTCARLTRVTQGDVEIVATLTPTAGRRLLLHQTQDAFATSGEAGPLAATGNAGRFQIVEIVSSQPITGGLRIDVEPDAAPFLQSDVAGRAAQACSMPQFTTFRSHGATTLTAPPWDGQTGGILAFGATGQVQIDGPATVSGLGFHGGVVRDGFGDGSNETALDTSDLRGGGKGESADGRAWALWGRGNLANGGGGGNAHNAGGGGGANAGAGGRGGADRCEDAPACSGADNATFGMRGAAMVSSARDRLYFGGGGGSGHRQPPPNGNDGRGGAGGGIVLISAGWIRSPGGGSIRADGMPGGASSGDGAGGGGGGGTIWLLTNELQNNFDGDLSARGGDGGDSNDTNFPMGPGGGGGGGRIRIDGPLSPADVKDVSGGLGAVCNHPDYTGTLGATNGDAGIVE